MSSSKHHIGFTIIELLIVIVVIAVLAAISIIAYNGIQNRAIETTLKSDLRNAATKLGTEKAINETYPATESAALALLSASTGTNFQYTSTDGGVSYCVTATSDRAGTSPFHTTNDGSIESGTCSGHYTPVQIAATVPPTDCPAGFIPVPGNIPLGTNGFCVMKYEAKNVGGTAKSRATGKPWVSISQTDAITASTATCSGCHLITEPEWMTIAANVLSVSSNWSSGTVGTGFIYSGHSDNQPAAALAASSSDDDGYNLTNNSSPSNQRRTLTLTNGEVIWDFAGNVREWTDATITGAQPTNGTGNYAWREYTDITDWGNLPIGSRPSIIGAGSYTASHGIGRVYSSGNETGSRAFLRGGNWLSRSDTGVLSLGSMSMDIGTSVGFRAAQ